MDDAAFPSIAGRQVDHWMTEEFADGDFFWGRAMHPTKDDPCARCVSGEHRTLLMKLPGVLGGGIIHVTTNLAEADKQGSQGTFHWWDGDVAHPTVRPSIGMMTAGAYEWHGWLEHGYFRGANA